MFEVYLILSAWWGIWYIAMIVITMISLVLLLDYFLFRFKKYRLLFLILILLFPVTCMTILLLVYFYISVVKEFLFELIVMFWKAIKRIVRWK